MKTALIVVDMQNSFLHPRGENYYPGAPQVVNNCRRLIGQARTSGKVVVHVADRHRDAFSDFENMRLPRHCLGGRFDAEYFEGFGPLGNGLEIEIVKRRFSAFFATELALFLKEQSIERIVVCGVKTNLCVRATAQDGFAHGFDTCVVRDATNSNRQHLADAALEDIERYIGRLVSTEEAMDLVS